MGATKPYIENEVKLPVLGTPDQARNLIEAIGYRIVHPRTLEADQVFDRDGELRSSEQLLRLRRSGKESRVTYKAPPRRERHKSREEVEFDVSDPDAFVTVLERLGYKIAFRYEKYRTKFRRGEEQGEITIDETPIGVFLELEGPPAWVDRTAQQLGRSPSEYLTSSYGKLYAEYRSKHPGAPADMVFDAKQFK